MKNDLDESVDLRPGTLDLLVLRILGEEPLHGYGIARRIEALSRNAFRVEQGSLYPALYRLERDGLVRPTWGTSETGRRVKVFELTGAGERKAEAELASWDRFVQAVQRVVRAE